MERRRLTGFKALLAFAAIALILFFARGYWLPALASVLVHDDGPARADMIVVLAGDLTGGRVLRAVELIRQGYAPVALVSGPDGFFGRPESEFEIQYAVSQGARPEWFISFPSSVNSTQEEAQAILPELRRRNVRSVLIVTSDYHTARARRIYLKAARNSGIVVRVTAAPDRFFNTRSWWRSRPAQKVFFFEWCKTVSSVVGL